MGKLEKKVAVITGAASGIGRATAIRFAGEGAAVVIADMNREGGEAAVRDCKENGGSAVFQLADVSSEGDIKGAVARAVKEFPRGVDRIHEEGPRVGWAIAVPWGASPGKEESPGSTGHGGG